MCVTLSLSHDLYLRILLFCAESFFDDDASKDEECYCLKCHNERREQNSIYSCGYPVQKYCLPIGWARFAVQ